eukprot:GEMP01071486.1.p1 GENE.GEMP01071486.1~~GEMP01071486.1.p1  ORF type:complete len:218 (+),score=47.84 GEMP01071486.1:141-794(+)
MIAAALFPKYRTALFFGVISVSVAHVVAALFALHFAMGASSLAFRAVTFALISLKLCYDYKVLCEEEEYPVLIKVERPPLVNPYNPYNPFNEDVFYGSVTDDERRCDEDEDEAGSHWCAQITAFLAVAALTFLAECSDKSHVFLTRHVHVWQDCLVYSASFLVVLLIAFFSGYLIDLSLPRKALVASCACCFALFSLFELSAALSWTVERRFAFLAA